MTNILVIEDEEAIRYNILQMLELEGYDGIAAEDGLEVSRSRSRSNRT